MEDVDGRDTGELEDEDEEELEHWNEEELGSPGSAEPRVLTCSYSFLLLLLDNTRCQPPHLHTHSSRPKILNRV